MKNTIYTITNTVNNKEYTGVHKTDDINDTYLGSGVAIKRAVDKYGQENFDKLTIGVFRTYEIALLVESWIVDKEYASRRDTYNMKPGGKGGFASNKSMTRRAIKTRKENLSKLSKEEVRAIYSRPPKRGKDNPRAKHINIYNEKDELIHECHGNLKEVCKREGLPFSTFVRSYNRLTKLYGFRKPTNTKYIKYTGWYARIV